MADTDEPITLGQIRRAAAAGDQLAELDELWAVVGELKARLERRTADVRTLANVVRILAGKIGLELTEASSGKQSDSVPTPLPEP